jgi:hypothetical protein
MPLQITYTLGLVRSYVTLAIRVETADHSWPIATEDRDSYEREASALFRITEYTKLSQLVFPSC